MSVSQPSTLYPATRSTHLRFNVQYGYESLLVDLADGLQPRSVHGVLVAAVLQVLVVADVLHHLVVGNEVVILPVLLVLLWRSGRVCRTEKQTSATAEVRVGGRRDASYVGWGRRICRGVWL